MTEDSERNQRTGREQSGQGRRRQRPGQSRGQNPPSNRRTRQRREDGTSLLKWGALYGAVAHILGYVMSLLLYSIDDNLGTESLEGTEASLTDGAAWVFYNAHFVDLELSTSGGAVSASGSINLLTDSEFVISGGGQSQTVPWEGTALPEVMFFAVPVVAIAGAVYLLVNKTAPTSAQEAAKRGGSVVVGSLPLALLGAVMSSHTETTSGIEVTSEPNLAMTVLLAGVVWPLVVGAASGYALFSYGSTPTGP